MRVPEQPPSTYTKFRILYLGNDLKFIAAMHQALTEPDYRLVACADRGGAVLFLKSDIQYDLMLIDFDWQGNEGLELAQLAQSLGPRKRMPIMLVTARKLKREVKALARKAGVKEFALKTPNVGAIGETIRQLIKSDVSERN